MRVIRFPSREEHWKARHKRGECPFSGMAKSNTGGLEEAAERAIQRIDSMASAGELTERRMHK